MKKIVKSLLFVAIVASMAVVGSCGGLLESSGDDVGDTSSTNHPLVGKLIKRLYLDRRNNDSIGAMVKYTIINNDTIDQTTLYTTHYVSDAQIISYDVDSHGNGRYHMVFKYIENYSIHNGSVGFPPNEIVKYELVDSVR